MRADGPILIKKYSNRRLYDTGDSRYITLDELASKIEGGASVRVVDAKSQADLTAAILTQVIIEGRGLAKLLPVELLEQLIRLGDDALAEFFGRWVVGALDVYLQAKRGIAGPASWNPLTAAPMAAQDMLSRLWMGMPFVGPRTGPPGPPERGSYDEPAPPAATSDDVAALRREIASLRDSMRDIKDQPGSSEE